MSEIVDSKIEAESMSGKKKDMGPIYQLAANENPGAIIAQVQFNGDNFDEWAQAIRTALRVKKKYGFIDGTVLRPDERSHEFEDWTSASSMVALWILNTIEAKVRRTLANKEDPAELWQEIKDRFSEGNGPRIQEIKTELANLRQGGSSVIDYYGKLQVLWDDLMNYEPTMTCKCGHCTCNLNLQIEKKKEDDKIHQFLLGLDETVYGAVRSSIISMDPLPNMNQTYAKVKSVERVQTMVRGREQQGAQMAFAARSGNVHGDREDKSKLFCTECKKTGHIAETCFQVIGYPTWWGEKSTPRQGGGRGGGRGRGRGGMIRANAVTTHESVESSGEAERNGFTGLTNEQWSRLIKILDDQKQSGAPRLSGPYNEESDWSRGT